MESAVRGRYTDTSTGYVKLYIPGRGVVEEHRYVMEQQLGRRLRSDETVHHLDGDKQNNAADNLTLLHQGTHGRVHAKRAETALVCAFCGVDFYRPTHLVKRGQKNRQERFYCCRSHQVQAQWEQKRSCQWRHAGSDSGL